MPYFCVECGAFQTDDEKYCSTCGAKSESATRVDLLKRMPKESASSELVDDLSEEVISRPQYIWYKTTRPWRRLWRRGLIWRFLLIVGASIPTGLSISGAVYWYGQESCNPDDDVFCVATVVSLVTPISNEFSDRLTEPANHNELSRAAEVYDAIVLLGLAWSNDQKITYREVTDLSAGDSNICTSVQSCVAAIQAGENIDYDGVSGSVYLGPDGVRGTYLRNRRHKERNVVASDPSDDRLIGRAFSNFRLPNSSREGSVLTVLSRFDSPTLSEAVKLASEDLKSARIDLQIREATRLPGDFDNLGEFVVVVADGFPNSSLRKLVGLSKTIITVNSEWRQIDDEDLLRLSAHPDMFAKIITAELKSTGDILIVGRCGFEGRVLESEIKKILAAEELSLDIRNECSAEELLASSATEDSEDLQTTLIVVEPIDAEPLLRLLYESGKISQYKKVIVLKPRSIRPTQS